MSTAFPEISDGAISDIVSGSLNNLTNPVTFGVNTGFGSFFPTVLNGFYFDIYDSTLGIPTPIVAGDPKWEVGFATVRSGDNITANRGALGTTAQAHTGTNVVVEINWKATLYGLITGAINKLENNVGSLTLIDLNNDASLSDINGFRLSTVTQTPVSPDSSVAASTLYFTPFINKQIATFISGSVQSWALHTSEEISIAAPSDGMYDVFVSWDTGALALNLNLVAWDTNTIQNDGVSTGSFLTAASDRMLTDGNDNTQRYVGSVYVLGGMFQDNPSGRFVWNFQNRLPRSLVGSIASASSSSITWASELSLPFCVGSPYDSNYATPPPQDTILVTGQVFGQGNSGASAYCEAALTLATPTPDPGSGHAVIPYSTPGSAGLSLAAQPPNPGLNSVDLLLRTSINTHAVTLSSPDGSFNSNAVKAIIYA